MSEKTLTLTKAEETKKKGWYVAVDSNGTKYGTNIAEIVNYVGFTGSFQVGEQGGKFYINTPLPEKSEGTTAPQATQGDPDYSYFLSYATKITIAMIEQDKIPEKDYSPSNLAIFINTLQENLLTGRDAWLEQRDIPF